MAGLDKLVDMVLTYENKDLQLKALSVVPVGAITDKASKLLRKQQKAARKTNKYLDETELYEYFLLSELVNWFKKDYFSWVDVRYCKGCNINMNHVKNYSRTGTATSLLYLVEVFRCFMCGNVSEFPRYNDAHMLLISREGRCSEWAQVFTLIVRALGWRARYVYDLTDHAWTEVFSPFLNRWIHIDPCEGLVDSPLTYELGWGKKLTFVFGVSCEDIQDITWRYSCDHKSLMTRRLPHLEKYYLHHILHIRKNLLSNLSKKRRSYVLKGVVTELAELLVEPKQSGHYKGRISGSHAWRESRSELGLSAQKGYTWTPIKNEIEKKELVLGYCTSKDVYVRKHDEAKEFSHGWQNYTFSTDNLFRKEENDWKMTYLAKQDESKNGVITWKFDLLNSSLAVNGVKIKCNCFVLNSGNVRWELESKGLPVVRAENVDYFETFKLENSINFTLSAYIGEDLKSNWQHSQLFRQPFDTLECSFVIAISLKKIE